MHHAASHFDDEFDFWDRSAPLAEIWESTVREGMDSGEFMPTDIASLFSVITGHVAFYLVLAKQPDEPTISDSAKVILRDDLLRVAKALLIQH